MHHVGASDFRDQKTQLLSSFLVLKRSGNWQVLFAESEFGGIYRVLEGVLSKIAVFRVLL